MSARFAVGDEVHVRSLTPPGHVRTPYYCRGKSGTVVRICGEYPNPEKLAYGDVQAEAHPLYRVRFAQRELWPAYAGTDRDAVEIEIYEHWLDPA